MTQEAYVRLPSRLRNVVRADDAANGLPAPLLAPPAPPKPSVEQQLLERWLADLGAAAHACQTRMDLWRRELKCAAVELAMAVAERFLGRRIESEEYPYLELLQQGLERLAPARAKVMVHLHPLDLESVRRLQAAENTPAPDHLEFQADPTMRRGDLRLETPDQEVELSLTANLARLRQELLEWAAHA